MNFATYLPAEQAARRLAWCGIWVLGALATAVLAAYASTNGSPAWEAGVVRSVQDLPLPGLHQMSLALTTAGREPLAVVLPAAAIAALWLVGQQRLAGFLFLAAVARVLSGVVKALVDRPRPSEALVDVSYYLDGPSFPSGHVLTTALFFGFLCYASLYLFPQRSLRLGVQVFCLVVIALMGIARMELGAHWPTDVLGGYLIAALVLGPLIWLHRRSVAVQAEHVT